MTTLISGPRGPRAIVSSYVFLNFRSWITLSLTMSPIVFPKFPMHNQGAHDQRVIFFALLLLQILNSCHGEKARLSWFSSFPQSNVGKDYQIGAS
jgi:hypothetical protein